MTKYFIRTYGCQMNERESEKLSGALAALGYERAASENEAGLILYNTCCVRENAENKIFGNLSRLKHRKISEPNLLIAVCGCMVQQKNIFDEIVKRHRYIDIVFGTANHFLFPQLLRGRIETGKPVYDISGADKPPKISPCETDALSRALTEREHSYKAGVNVMYGCNNFCSYCIVPYVRGRERSRRPEDILREIRALADDGVKEIMLLGQNVNSYGLGLDEPAAFAKLLRSVNEIDGLRRIRFMTSHPKDMSAELIEAVRDCEKVCKAVHLPLQSGSSRVLKNMNRKYTKEDFLRLTEKIRERIPGAAVSTDIIVGFPGETEEDFLETLDVVKRVNFSGAFTFIYSKRSGTPAARNSDEIPPEVVKDRFNRLTETVNPMLQARNEARIGTELEVMLEEETSKLGTRGRAEDNTLVHVTGIEKYGTVLPPGSSVKVKIKEARTFYLVGEGKNN